MESVYTADSKSVAERHESSSLSWPMKGFTLQPYGKYYIARLERENGEVEYGLYEEDAQLTINGPTFTLVKDEKQEIKNTEDWPQLGKASRGRLSHAQKGQESEEQA